MKINLFGRIIDVIKRDNQWLVFDLGNEGKKRLAQDVLIPPTVKEKELLNYLDDLCHEWSSSKHPRVKLVE